MSRARGVEGDPETARLLVEISSKLDRIAAVLAAQGKERNSQIDILSAAGCDSNFIGIVVGMTGAAVRKHQSRRRGRIDPGLDVTQSGTQVGSGTSEEPTDP